MKRISEINYSITTLSIRISEKKSQVTELYNNSWMGVSAHCFSATTDLFLIYGM